MISVGRSSRGLTWTSFVAGQDDGFSDGTYELYRTVQVWK